MLPLWTVPFGSVSRYRRSLASHLVEAQPKLPLYLHSLVSDGVSCPTDSPRHSRVRTSVSASG
ncbi:hypothetical protein D1794_30465 (plasmid) [Streptomyces clavuligerus]|nr:hypothetical protein D1794_30465 [Streptomyces clavuligerus]